MTPIQAPRLVPLMALLALCPLVALAQLEPAKVIKANASRLKFETVDGQLVATLKGKPFTGVAFWDEPWGRAEVTYLSGVLHGEVTVVAGKKLLARFSYENGKKVLPSATSANGETSPEVSSEAGDRH